jgi:hypothetical protein
MSMENVEIGLKGMGILEGGVKSKFKVERVEKKEESESDDDWN